MITVKMIIYFYVLCACLMNFISCYALGIDIVAKQNCLNLRLNFDNRLLRLCLILVLYSQSLLMNVILPSIWLRTQTPYFYKSTHSKYQHSSCHLSNSLSLYRDTIWSHYHWLRFFYP